MRVAKDKTLSSSERLLQLIRPAAGDAAKPASAAPGSSVPKPKRRMRFLPLGAQSYIGVDIASTQIVCVKTRGHDSGFEILGTVITPLPAGAEPGTPEFVTLLHKTLSQLCAPGERPVIWAASQTAKVNIQYLTIPKVASRQVDNAVFWTAKKEMGFDEGMEIFDFERRGEITEKGALRLGALAYTASRETAKVLRDDFSRAGFHVRGLTMESFAHQNLFRRRVVSGAGGATAVLHVGRNWSRLEIGSNKNLLFVRVIKTSMSGMEQSIFDALTERLASRMPAAPEPAQAPAEGPIVPAGETVVDLDAQTLDGTGFVLELDTPVEPAAPSPAAASQTAAPESAVRPEDARELLCALYKGCESLSDDNPGRGLDESEIMAMLEPAAARLVRQVEMTIKHFREALGFEDVTRIMVSGPLGGSHHFVKFIGEQLGIGSMPLDPLGAYLAEGGVAPGLAAPCPVYAQALGLALSDVSITPSVFFTYRQKAEVRSARVLEQCALVGVAAVLVGLAVWSFKTKIAATGLRSEQAAVVRDLDSLGGKPDLAALTTRVAAFRARRQAAHTYIERTKIPALWGAAIDLAPEGVAVGTLSAEFAPPADLLPPKSKGRGDAQKREAPARLALSGLVTGDPLLFESRLASYVMALEQSPWVASVSVKNEGQEVLEGGGTGLHFTISLVLAEKPQ